MPTAGQWWRGACLYEVYLRSFQDSDADGIGDLDGLLSRLDYLAWLGVDGIWITPFFPSPMHDAGYDVSDYRAVDPRYGTLEGFRRVVDRAHALGLKVVIDQVYSHSSDRHPWFIDSASGSEGRKADWYVWADSKPDGSPPNNWLARFGGGAWEWHAGRRQYYLHNFLIEQPDLNVQNPDVQDEIVGIMRFWFDVGVDGLRLDVVNFYMHDPDLRDNPPRECDTPPANPYYLQERRFDRSRPENLPFLARMREVAGDRILLGEISCDWQVERMAEYTASGRLHSAYSFELLCPDLDGVHLAQAVTEAGAGSSWPCWAFSNHDCVRVATRWGAEDNPSRIKMMQALLLCLRGNVILYQGEELGLTHSAVPRDKLQDPEAIRFWPHGRGRDGARTPMAWEDSPGLGFSDVDGWLPAEQRHCPCSVAMQVQDPDSILAHCRMMIGVRSRLAALRLGSFDVVEADATGLSFRRRHEGSDLLCSFNFSDADRPLPPIRIGVVHAGATAADCIGPQSYVVAEILH